MTSNKAITNFIINRIRPKIDRFNHFADTKLSFKSKSKNAVDPVTSIDVKIDREVTKLIKDKFPSHLISSEENKKTKDTKNFNSIIDPVDGTKSLILGLPTWSNLIGYYVKNKPKIGFANFPKLGKYYYSDGQSTYKVEKNKKKIKISAGKINSKTHSLVLNSIHPLKKIKIFKKILKFRGILKLSGADAFNYCLLAEGKIDTIIDLNVKTYDILPLIPILKNSGAVITNFKGRLDFKSPEILVSRNLILHKKMLKLLKNDT